MAGVGWIDDRRRKNARVYAEKGCRRVARVGTNLSIGKLGTKDVREVDNCLVLGVVDSWCGDVCFDPVELLPFTYRKHAVGAPSSYLIPSMK